MFSSKTYTNNNTERDIPSRSIGGKVMSFPPKDFQFQTPRAIQFKEIERDKEGNPDIYICRCYDVKVGNAQYNGLDATTITGCRGKPWRHADLFKHNETGYIFMHDRDHCKTGAFGYVLCSQEGCCSRAPTVVPTEKAAIIYHATNEHLSYLQAAMGKPTATDIEIRDELFKREPLFYDKKKNRWLLEKPVFLARQEKSFSIPNKSNGKERMPPAEIQLTREPSVDATLPDEPSRPLYSKSIGSKPVEPTIALETHVVLKPIIVLETNIEAVASVENIASVVNDVNAFTEQKKREKKKNPKQPILREPVGPSTNDPIGFAGRKKLHDESTQQLELSLDNVIKVLAPTVPIDIPIQETTFVEPNVSTDVVEPNVSTGVVVQNASTDVVAQNVSTESSSQQLHTIIEIPQEEPSHIAPSIEILEETLYLERFCKFGTSCRNKDFKEGQIPCAFNHTCTLPFITAGHEVPIGFCKCDRPFTKPQAKRCKNKFCTYDHSKGRVAFILKQQEYETKTRPRAEFVQKQQESEINVPDSNGDISRKKKELEERMKQLLEMQEIQNQIKRLEDQLHVK